MDAHELKALQVRATKLAAEVQALELEKGDITKRLSSMRQDLNNLNQRIANAASKEPIVTEHALLRYIERVIGIDLDQMAARILTEQNRKAIEFAGNCRIRSNGVEFVVKDRRVVSVVA